MVRPDSQEAFIQIERCTYSFTRMYCHGTIVNLSRRYTCILGVSSEKPEPLKIQALAHQAIVTALQEDIPTDVYCFTSTLKLMNLLQGRVC